MEMLLPKGAPSHEGIENLVLAGPAPAKQRQRAVSTMVSKNRPKESVKSTDSLVTVSDGHSVMRVEPTRLPELRRRGFYRPEEHGLTIVSNDGLMFEIPLCDLAAATEAGYHDVQESDLDRSSARPRLKRFSAVAASSASATTTASASVDTPNVEGLITDGLMKAEIEAEQEQLQRQQEVEEATGLRKVYLAVRNWLDDRRVAMLNHLRGSGVSIAIHVAIFLLLASLALVQDQEPKGLFISATPASEEIVEEMVIEPSPLEVTDPTESEESEAPPEAEETPPELAEAINAPNFLANVSGDAVAAPAEPSPAADDGKEMPKKQSKVFGTAKSATDYVFVIDNSNSMTKGRFETALYELMTAINSLTPKQNFFIIFYSDTAYAMMHPKPVSKMVAATPRAKEIVNVWLNTVPLCLRTNGREAIELGFKLNPDVMYILGDGAFTDKAHDFVARMPRTKTIVHCRGMEVDANKARGFEAIAKAHGGTYKDVGVHPYAAELAKKKPRPRNSIRNGYWGLKLPLEKKPKT